MLHDRPDDEKWREIVLGHGPISKEEYAERVLGLMDKPFSNALVIVRDWRDIAAGLLDRLVNSLLAK